MIWSLWAMEQLNVSPPLCMTILMTVFWTDGLAMVHQHPPCHYPGHHQVFVLLHQTTLYGAKSRDKCLHTTITTTSWRGLWQRHHHNYTINTLAQITQDLAEIRVCLEHSRARSGAVGWGTVLQAGRLRVRFPMVSSEFFIDITLSATLWD